VPCARTKSRPRRVFLLSPAICSGERAKLLLRPEARFDLARRVQSGGAPIAEVFAFLSGLYFRGKLAYAAAFAHPPPGAYPALVITSSLGLVPPERPTTAADLQAFNAVNIDVRERRYVEPLLATALELKSSIPPRADVVLLGSIASGKYVDVLLPVFGRRLKFPPAFVGRGDMSRGGMMLRRAYLGQELEYAPVLGAALHGERPPRLARTAYR